MRRVEKNNYKKWDKMWLLWKLHRLDSPLDELITYDNCMAHGHYYFFKSLKTDSEIKRHIFVMTDSLPEDYIENLKKAYRIYTDNKIEIDSGKFDIMELEDLFLEVDEFFYRDAYKVLSIIMTELETTKYIN